MKQSQLEFQTVLDQTFAAQERKFLRYIKDNVELYKGYATFITPSLNDPKQIFSRIAFAILSANARFDDSVKALGYAMENIGKVDATVFARYRMTPAKADYLNELADTLPRVLLRQLREPWGEYRERLMKVKGLHRAKASFAVALLYPLEADVACLDTWMQKVFLGMTGFRRLSRGDYELVEGKIRGYAKRFNVSTFLIQWLIWDYARGGQPNAHAIFPSSHKSDLTND